MGRSNISQAALGTSHSLFLDHDGSVWSCGENKEVGTLQISASWRGLTHNV